MAGTEEKIEEVVEEKVETPESKEPEIPQEVKDANEAFDNKLDEEDDSVEKKDEAAEEVKPAAEEKADEKVAGEEKVADEEKLIAAEAEKLEKDILSGDEQRAAEAKAKAEKIAEEQKASAEPEDKPYDCGLDPEDYDEGVIKQFNKVGQAQADEAKALKTENDQLRASISQQASARQADWFDRQVEKLGSDFHEVLGEGEFDDLEPASVPFENRNKVAARMNLVVKTYQKLNKPVPTRSKLFKEAISHLFNKETNKSKIEADTAAKLADTAGQAVGGGSGKTSKLSAASNIQKTNADFDRKLDED